VKDREKFACLKSFLSQKKIIAEDSLSLNKKKNEKKIMEEKPPEV